MTTRYIDETEEGQFKHFIYHVRGYVCSVVHKTCNTDALEAKNFLDIVYEAKKEFPIDEAVKFHLPINTAKTWEELIQQYIKITQERTEWFKKWFGASP